jgi:hypothetical protein
MQESSVAPQVRMHHINVKDPGEVSFATNGFRVL